MARKQNATVVEAEPTVDPATVVEAEPTVEAFLLRDCVFGPAGTVVLLTEQNAKAGEAQGMLDLHPDAIKAAKGE